MGTAELPKENEGLARVPKEGAVVGGAWPRAGGGVWEEEAEPKVNGLGGSAAAGAALKLGCVEPLSNDDFPNVKVGCDGAVVPKVKAD